MTDVHDAVSEQYATPAEDAEVAAVVVGTHALADDPAPERWGWARTLSGKYALVAVWAAMALVYYVLKPDTFGRTTTVQSIFGSQELLVFMSMAALSTLIVGEFDLSIASVMGLGATIVAVLNGQHGVDIWLACAIAIAATAACGAANAFFIVALGVPSLVVTLGSGSLFLGLAEWMSGSGGAVSVEPNTAFLNLTQWHLLGMSVSFWYGLAIIAGFAYVCACTPLGRHLMFVGANREVARLAGIRVNRIRAGSYVTAGLFNGLAAVVLLSQVGGIDATNSSVYLLPTLAAVFLSTAVVQPGQFNAVGTVIGIYFLETGIFGLQLMGLSGWIQDVFYGGGLVFAVALATLVRRRATTA